MVASSARIPAMNRRKVLQSLPAAALLPAAAWPLNHLFTNNGPNPTEENAMPASTAVYELRIYHATEGKLDQLLARFRDHTDALFKKHNMKSLAYWTPTEGFYKGNILIYILEHPSREAASANWQAFRDDPDWIAVRDKSEANGKLVDHIDSTYMTLTDFSRRPG
jgi:NIPSNAP